MFVNVFARGQNIAQSVVMFMDVSQFIGRDHKSHFDILKGLQDGSGDDSTDKSVQAFLINHFNLMQIMNLINNFNRSFIQRPISANIIQMPKKQIDFVKIFLENSPINQYKKFMKIITVPQSHKIPAPLISNEDYLKKYMKSFDQIPTRNPYANFTEEQLRKITAKTPNTKNKFPLSEKQSIQLMQNIKKFYKTHVEGLIPYQELQQCITIAQPETINQLRTHLNYLFKILLNQRENLTSDSLQLIVNIELSQAIVKAFSRSSQYPENTLECSKLQAIQNLTKARQYQKKGLKEDAMKIFQQIFKDKTAQDRTRMQALMNICSEGDITILQPLMVQTQEKGEKQFEQYLKQSIKKINQGLNSQSND